MDAAPSNGRPRSSQVPSMYEVFQTIRYSLTAGAGLFADGYDLSVINLGLAMLAQLYADHFTPASAGAVVSATLIGVLVGQCATGVIADIVGRKIACLMTAASTIVAAILSGCVVDTDTPGFSIATQLLICRFLLGLGIGGEYPLSAALTEEMDASGCALPKAKLLCVNKMLFHMGCLVQAILVAIMIGCNVSMEFTWRFTFILGALPAMCAFALRINIEEPPVSDPEDELAAAAGGGGAATSSLSTGVAEATVVGSSTGSTGETTDALMAGPTGMPAPISRPRKRTGVAFFRNLQRVLGRRWPVLCGASAAWFIHNFSSYGLTSFASTIAQLIFPHAPGTPVNTIIVHDAYFAIFIGIFELVGDAIGISTEHKMSRRTLLMTGFFGQGVLMILCGLLFLLAHQQWILITIIFVSSRIFYSISALGTYIIPTEAFPSTIRGTSVGIAAAAGKVGASVGSGIFPICVVMWGLSAVLTFCGLFSMVGILVALMLIPSPLHAELDPCNPCGSRDATKTV